jgi:hypothetical protein
MPPGGGFALRRLSGFALNQDRHQGLAAFALAALGRSWRRGRAAEGLAIDREAFGRQLLGLLFLHALHALHEVGPVLELAFLARIEDALGHRGADALDAVEVGHGALVDIDRGERCDGEQHGRGGQDLLEHDFSNSLICWFD